MNQLAGLTLYFSYAHYFGDSYLKFKGLHLNPQNNISLEFQTYSSSGLLLYIEQAPATIGRFFIQLFIQHSILQYQFVCDSEADVRSINTMVRVDDGVKYRVHIRQDVVPCEAEVSILGISARASMHSNLWSHPVWSETGPIFLGGLPYQYVTKQMPGSVYNFTGCIQVIEINNLGPFTFSNAVGRSNIDSCRLPISTQISSASPAAFPEKSEVLQSLVPSLNSFALPTTCQESLCHNGGTCRHIYLDNGASSFHCDCQLHFTGHFCEKDTALFFPSFNGDAYLELPSLTSVSETKIESGQEQNRIITIYLTVKTTALNGTILYASEKNFGEQFLHLYLVEGRPTVQFSCGNSHNILTVSVNHSISNGVLTPITISYMLPVGSPGGYCMIEIAAEGNPPVQHQVFLSYQVSQSTFGSTFLGSVPAQAEVPQCAGRIHGYRGCIKDFQVNNKELFIIDEALSGKNIENCNVPVCDYHPCRNGGSCKSLQHF
ncbi:hypothetical protein Y1Q_0014009 [Alligator mississippiensis]|uniref:EGF-like domain-containing protein n=1 Tax=Alligator mississippiensis TaxID=8496 RepID=A0A151PDS4_ALLMI|nr:hypothetical protein Y1Q_0014009 [Alligator mississippiensis]